MPKVKAKETTSYEDLCAYDNKHLWHPYASAESPHPVYPVASAQGVRLKLEDERELIDGMSSWWAAIHGYNHPFLNAAAVTQLRKMSHVMFGGLTHRPALDLARKLLDLSPKGLERVFFCDSGSVSVEVAIKMAQQFWLAKNKAKKQKLLTVRSGYHGDTLACMAVCDPQNGMHKRFGGILPKHFFADPPFPWTQDAWDPKDIAGLEELLSRHASEIAAVIIEPLVQGAGGMRFYHPDYLVRLRALCDEHEVLFIADEIATGFGRSGSMFACERAGVTPDIMCVGKALTGGYLSLAATLATGRISRGIAADGNGVLMHGPTFMANPLACAVAKASIDLLLSSDWKAKVLGIEKKLKHELAFAREYGHVADVRVLGAIGVIQLTRPVDLPAITKRFVEAGVWLRPFGRLVYTMPPFVISADELCHLTSAMLNVLKDEACLVSA
jgi:adenosylmethionine-8-amino-7-oxononanoate aminotransferase